MSKLTRFGLIIAVCSALLFALYQIYPSLLYQVLLWQKSFNQQIADALRSIEQNQQQAGMMLLLISFLYGVFHAVGPGHGKFILTGYLTIEKTKLPQAIKMTLSSAIVQGLVAILLVSSIIVLFTLSRSFFNTTVQWVERFGFLVMISFGGYWCYQAIKNIMPKKVKLNVRSLSKPTLQSNSAIRPLITSHSHQHSQTCSCGHKHLPDSTQLEQAKDWKAELMIILSIGARPCSGAILVLFLAYTLGLYAWGIASALAMALGTGITLSLFAWFVISARHKAIRLSGWYLSEQHSKRLVFGLKLLVGMIIIGFGIMLLHGTFIDTTTNPLLKR